LFKTLLILRCRRFFGHQVFSILFSVLALYFIKGMAIGTGARFGIFE